MSSSMHGVVPLTGRLEPWMREVLADHAGATALLEEHGSPVNLVHPGRLPDHAAELVEAAAQEGVELRVFFARKANKTIAAVDAALAAGHGVDVASRRELEQVLARLAEHDAGPERVIVSAGVKPRGLLQVCVESGVVVSVDNADEHALLTTLAAAAGRPVDVALRLTADLRGVEPSRFGQHSATLAALLAEPGPWEHGRLVGFHFHLHGYAAEHRALALDQALDLVEVARHNGHDPDFVDVGGGVPMRYLEAPEPLEEFWDRHRSGDDPMTWQDRPLGHVYPVWQDPVRGPWLTQVLRHPSTTGEGTVADRVRSLGIRLHAEPGRALLDGCGLTLARVEHRKQRPDGTWLVGLAMNRTQCRSAADDFLVDPVLVPGPSAGRTPPGEAHLVGAYCIEAELLTWRRMVLPDGAAVGDVVAFVNTAGYQMHILESASHQIPLALNLVPDGARWVPDAIDG